MGPSPGPEGDAPARRRRIAVAAGLLLAVGAARAVAAAPEHGPDAPRLSFAFHGRPVTSLGVPELRLIAAPREVRVHEPYEGREVAFRAFAFDAILDAVYGEATWREEQELLFDCRDGYRPTVPVRRFLAHRAWLAFARVGSDDFSLMKHESGAERKISLAPFYLIWENLDDHRVRQEADYGWPYQLVGVDLIRTHERFRRMQPPPGASASVRAGFEAFRVHCSRCHAIHDEGGRIGPDLGATDLVRGVGRTWLRTWIDDPSRIAPGARMERLNPSLPDRERVIEEILDYLEAVEPAPEDGPGR